MALAPKTASVCAKCEKAPALPLVYEETLPAFDTCSMDAIEYPSHVSGVSSSPRGNVP